MKIGFSLEVVIYWVLLEGESNLEIVIWVEYVENMLLEFRNKFYYYIDLLL